jgi:hypothetical protein
MELHDWMAQDVVLMHAALDEIWTRWDQDGVRLANDVVGKGMDLLGTSTASQPAKAESVSASGQWGNDGHPESYAKPRLLLANGSLSGMYRELATRRTR